MSNVVVSEESDAAALPVDEGALDRAAGWTSRHELHLLFSLLAVGFAVLLLWGRVVVFIHPGQTGVMWDRFQGTDLHHVYDEGTHLIWPWNEMYIYDGRIATVDQTVTVQSKEGLTVVVGLTVRYDPVDKLMAALHQQVGPDYVNRIVIPEAVRATREVIGTFPAEDLYSIEPGRLEADITRQTDLATRRRFIVTDAVLLRSIKLPDVVNAAIQRKIEAEQIALTYPHQIDAARLEQVRKQIEAQGIQDYEKIVAAGVTDKYLQWQGIQATLELAQSPNAKVVVIGGGKNGLPLILSTEGTITSAAPTGPAPAASNAAASPSTSQAAASPSAAAPPNR